MIEALQGVGFRVLASDFPKTVTYDEPTFLQKVPADGK